MYRSRLFPVAVIAAILSIVQLNERLQAREATVAISGEKALQRLKEGNERYVVDKLEPKDLSSQRRKELAQGQHPFAVVVTCSDSRVPPELVFDQGLGGLFVIRVAGNIADAYTLGSIEYAVEHLHVPLVVILGHDHCGAVHAAMETNRPAGNLGTLLEEVHPGDLSGLAKEASESLPAKNNALYQAKSVTGHSKVIRELVREKKVQIVPALYHLDSGEVEWLAK
jgi:carbonic anhydrase